MADRYWVASSAQSWNSTSYWSETSGGASGASVPSTSDNAIFDGNGLGNCTLNTWPTVINLTFTSGYTGTFTIGSNYRMITTGTLTLGANMTLSVSSSLSDPVVFNPATTGTTVCSGFTASNVSWSSSGALVFRGNLNSGTLIVAASVFVMNVLAKPGTNKLGDYVLSGDITFKKNFSFEPNATYGNITVVPSGYNITFEGDVDAAAGANAAYARWTKSTGTITFDGGEDQDVDFNGLTVEDLVINKDSQSDKVTLTGDVVTDSLTLTSGTLDINAYDLETTGNFTAAAGTSVDDGAASPTGLITVGGNFDLNGTSGSGITWTDADLDITGTAEASYTTASGSDASAGTEVDATDNCTDSGSNTNWNFGGAVTAIAKLIGGKLVNFGNLICGGLAR